ncbi:MAG: DNA polymerase III subunit delta' [Candidatus Ancaeobacter aquaticus]|nr:DNA polymerase III subunit delta' [Candidatus Ancaeobacter aquaticus]
MSFKDVLGHESIVSRLLNSISTGKVGHAYLYCGVRGVGKRFVALQFAKALNCTQRDMDSCDTCESCKKINGMNHADVKWYGPSGTSRLIKIESAREITKSAYLKPYEARKKVFIISDVDLMNPAASNALLKTLEEPPADTVFVLTTSHKDSVLPTISSRCQIIDFNPVSVKYIEDILRQRYNLDESDIELYSAIAAGRIGRIETILNSEYMARRKMVLEEIVSGKCCSITHVVSFVEGMLDALRDEKDKQEDEIKESRGEITDIDKAYIEGAFKDEIIEMLRFLILLYRDIVACKVASGSYIVNVDHREVIDTLAEKYTLERLEVIIESIEYVKNAIMGNGNLKLALECLFLKIGEAA